jgi:DNA-binding response OmpR family regulator
MHIANDTAPRHAAYGAALEELNIVVIDPSRTMQTILRSMLQQLRPKRIRIYDAATDALRDMLLEPPSLVLTDWRMEPISGHRLLKVLRHKSMAPLCFVPIIVVTGQATRSSVESAFRTGSHAVLVKPIAPTALRQRIEWILHDDRTFALAGENWVIAGVADVLDAQREKERLPSIIAEIGAGNSAEGDARSIVERIVQGNLGPDEADSTRRSRRLREDMPSMSPTLHRLVRRRAQMVASEQATRAEPKPAPPKKPSERGRTRWADIWLGR